MDNITSEQLLLKLNLASGFSRRPMGGFGPGREHPHGNEADHEHGPDHGHGFGAFGKGDFHHHNPFHREDAEGGNPFRRGDGPIGFPMRRPHHGGGRVLALINKLGGDNGVSQTELAEHLCIRPQSLCEALSRLEQLGLIERRVSEQDRRRSLVFLTQAGKDALTAFQARLKTFAEDFFAPLSQEERMQLGRLLDKVINAKS